LMLLFMGLMLGGFIAWRLVHEHRK